MNDEKSLINFALRMAVFGYGLAISMGFSAYSYYLNYKRRQNFEAREIELALKRFDEIITIASNENKQSDLMILHFQQQVLKINEALESLMSQDISYEESRSDYPQIPELVKMSSQLIHYYCNLFEEHHQKRSVFCSDLAQKGSEEITKYEKLI